MPDFILIDGDIAQFLPNFGAAVVVVQPGALRGSGRSTYRNKPLCIRGDEGSVQVPGCMYISGAFSNPGTGTLKISALGSDQLARQTRSNGEPVLLKGSRFEAVFEVQSPATNNSGGFDTTPQYSGSGQFVSANTNYKGT